jgi:hypothetical protein
MSHKPSPVIRAAVGGLVVIVGLPVLYLLSVPALIRVTSGNSPIAVPAWVQTYGTGYNELAEIEPLQEPLQIYAAWWHHLARPGIVTIYGQVGRQGRFEIRPGKTLTLSQAILRAGGLAPLAKDTKIKVIRKVTGKGNVTVYVNLREIMVKGNVALDLPIRDRDVIIVDEKLINF